MVTVLVLGLGLLAAAPDQSKPPATSADALAAYREEVKGVGRDPAAHVRLALWCEARGLDAERTRHLALAVLADPKNAAARALMGLVAYRGRWARPEAVAEAVRADQALNAALAEYNARRDHTPGTAEAQWKLALWCEENGLKAEAVAHLTAVTRLDPGREGAWTRLGYRKHNGRWVTDAKLSAEKSDAEAQKKADHHWKPRLAKYRGWLHDKSETRRAEAEEALAKVTDPRAVPAVWAVFAAPGGPGWQARAVELFGQIDAPSASRALTSLAISGGSGEVRRSAIETLGRRDGRDFLGVLIGLIRDPLKVTARPVGGPDAPGELLVEGPRYNVRRVYGLTAFQKAGLRLPPRLYAGNVPFDPFSPQNLANASGPSVIPAVVPGRAGAVIAPNLTAVAAREDLAIAAAMVRNQNVLALSQQQLANDLAAVESYNAEVGQANGRALSALHALSGQDLGESSDAWQAWWADQRGYVYEPSERPKPTFTTFVANPAVAVHHSCFAAGTPVRGLTGLVPIQSIRTGDLVLTQDPATGRLDFQPVVAVFHNKPSATFRIRLGAETVVATGIHRFWKAGHGWVMARDLKPGDVLRTLGGTAAVASVSPERVQPVFNLEVASGQSFFVGKAGALVHDNSLVSPVEEPFDAPAAVVDASASASAHHAE